MRDDDLGKRVTQVHGFKWKTGMWALPGPGEEESWVYVWPYDLDDDGSDVLDLEHFANTGFLLDLLSSIHDDAYANCVEVGFLSDEGGEYRELVAYDEGETVNHALARAILAAVERAS